MKIKSKKLTVALSLLLVSAVMLATASFAWFSMNTSVDVDGIEVEAYSDSLFLEVSADKDSGYATSVSLSGGKKYLRLAKHGFVTTAYTLNETAISTDTYFNGTNANKYYEKVELQDSNYKYVVATGLEAPGTVEGLYKNPVFVPTSADAVMVSGTVYYTLRNSSYVQVPTSAGAPAVGYYTLSLVYTAIDDDTATAEADTDYYQYAGGAYTKVENVVVGETLVGDYFTADDIAAEDAAATYDSGANYYKWNESEKSYDKVGGIFPGTNLNGYYHIDTLAPDEIDDLTTVTGKAFVETADGEYSLLGDFGSQTTDITDMLYFGRAYSDTLTDGDKGDALNIIQSANWGSYAYTKSFYLRNATNTNDSRNLQAQFTVGGDSALSGAVRVVLIVSDVSDTTPVYVNRVEYTKDTTGQYKTTYGEGSNIVNLLAGNKAQTLKVDAYVYYDGTDDVAMNATSGVLSLGGNTVDIKFTIDEPSYN